jgi:hypothetical protein
MDSLVVANAKRSRVLDDIVKVEWVMFSRRDEVIEWSVEQI